MSARPYLCRGLVSLILSRLGSDSTDALRSATADFVKSVELDPAAETYMRLAEAYVERAIWTPPWRALRTRPALTSIARRRTS